MQNQSEKKIKHIQKVKRPVIRACPCAIHNVSCSYVVISHILGCPYNCSYCFLHTFYGKDEIVIYDNHQDIIDQLSNYLKSAQNPLRVGTGQYSDSLALDKQTGFSRMLIDFFAKQDMHLLELKTKSAEVDHLLDLKHNKKTVFAWSVNPQKIVESDELGSVSLLERLSAAQKCTQAGYPVAFHFDPIIYYKNWEKDYKQVVDLIFSKLDSKDIAWISLGALRYPPALKDIIKKRFPDSQITCGAAEVSEDDKIRYKKSARIQIFKSMHKFIRAYSEDVYLYLCMETPDIWQESGIKNQNNLYSPYFKFLKTT